MLPSQSGILAETISIASTPLQHGQSISLASLLQKNPTTIEERINKKDRSAKVRNFPRATVADMEHYIIPIIQQKPSNIILHVGTNDAKNLPSRAVLDNLLKLKALLKDSLPTCRVFISTPTLRTDDDNVQITVRKLTKHLLQQKIDTINIFICLFIYLFVYLFIHFMLTITIKSIKHSDLYNSLYTNSYTNGIQ